MAEIMFSPFSLNFVKKNLKIAMQQKNWCIISEFFMTSLFTFCFISIRALVSY